ncbi:hypothetical protein [Nocardioides convexus]|uniref:hypothetical protein n=1 Tax=Nocardioides convexus TaxID=2712224 RepID=UPI0024182911|nr:hypothetical protein [Nocardioides convexus]
MGTSRSDSSTRSDPSWASTRAHTRWPTCSRSSGWPTWSSATSLTCTRPSTPGSRLDQRAVGPQRDHPARDARPDRRLGGQSLARIGLERGGADQQAAPAVPAGDADAQGLRDPDQPRQGRAHRGGLGRRQDRGRPVGQPDDGLLLAHRHDDRDLLAAGRSGRRPAGARDRRGDPVEHGGIGRGRVVEEHERVLVRGAWPGPGRGARPAPRHRRRRGPRAGGA